MLQRLTRRYRTRGVQPPILRALHGLECMLMVMNHNFLDNKEVLKWTSATDALLPMDQTTIHIETPLLMSISPKDSDPTGHTKRTKDSTQAKDISRSLSPSSTRQSRRPTPWPLTPQHRRNVHRESRNQYRWVDYRKALHTDTRVEQIPRMARAVEVEVDLQKQKR